MCCIVALMGLIGPRIAFLYAWIFTNEVHQAYGNFFVPLLGVILLPWTALFFAIAYAPIVGVEGFGFIFVAFGVLLDLATYAGGPRARSAM
jgi:hypothetical protein